jgi:hypothetical protein
MHPGASLSFSSPTIMGDGTSPIACINTTIMAKAKDWFSTGTESIKPILMAGVMKNMKPTPNDTNARNP